MARNQSARRERFRYPVTTLIGSRPGNLLDISSEYKVNPGYKAKFLLSGLVSALLEPFSLTEELIYGKRLRNFSPELPPVFIIGFWRSGTTLLHNLLCLDQNAAFTTTFQAVFPNLLMTQSWWLKPFANRFLPVNRPYDNVGMDMDFPQEEDLA